MTKPTRAFRFRFTLGFLTVSTTALIGCGDSEFDTRRVQAQPQSLGTAVYENFCDRIASSAYPEDKTGRKSLGVCHQNVAPQSDAPAKLVAFYQQRERLIEAIDVTVAHDPALANDLQTFLTRLLPLYDSGLMGQQSQGLTHVLQQLQRVPGAAQVLAHLGHRADATAPVPADATLLHGVLTYPRLHEALAGLVDVVGPQGAGEPAFKQLQQVLHAKLVKPAVAPWTLDAEPGQSLPSLLLSPHPETVQAPQPRWLLAHDGRGLPQVWRDAQGRLPAPFVEREGAVAVDAAGRFVGSDGQVLALRPWGTPNTAGFDAFGRAVRVDGTPLFVYRDIGASLLTGILQQGQRVLARAPTGLIDGAPMVRAAMGAEHVRSHRLSNGGAADIRAYDPNTSPAVDVAYTVGWMAKHPGVVPALTTLAEGMWSQHETALAAALQLAWQTSRALQVAPALTPHNTLLDDFLALGSDIASEPGLLEDLNAALMDPASRPLGGLVAAHMRSRDFIDYDPKHINAEPTGDFVTPVDRSQIDGVGNQSVMQRLMHLVHDTQQPLCNQAYALGLDVDACDLFKIDDAAMFYLKSMIGTARLTFRFKTNDPWQDTMYDGMSQPEGMSAMTGIAGFTVVSTRPEECRSTEADTRQCVTWDVTPQAAARLLFTTFDSRLSREDFEQKEGNEAFMRKMTVDGTALCDLHHGTIFAWEKHGFIEAMRPVLQALAKHQREDLMLKLLSLLHKHWATLQNPLTQHTDPTLWSYSAQTGVSRLEPLLAQLLDEGHAMVRAGTLLQAAHSIPVGPASGDQVLANAARLLLAPADASFALAARPYVKGDGTPVLRVAPVHVLLHAMAAMSADTLADGTLAAAAADTLLQVEPVGEHWQLRNRQAYALVQVALQFAKQQSATQHDFNTLGDKLTQAVVEAVDSPVLASAVQLMDHLAHNREASRELGQLLGTLLSEHPEAWVDMAATTLDALPEAQGLQPLVQVAAAAFAEDNGLAAASVQVLHDAYPADSQRVLTRLLAGLAQPMPHTGQMPLAVLLDVFTQVNRATPGSNGALTATDYTQGLVPTVVDFMNDKLHGFARLLDLIAHRNIGSEA